MQESGPVPSMGKLLPAERLLEEMIVERALGRRQKLRVGPRSGGRVRVRRMPP